MSGRGDVVILSFPPPTVSRHVSVWDFLTQRILILYSFFTSLNPHVTIRPLSFLCNTIAGRGYGR